MSKIDRNHPMFATIEERYPLSKEGSTKQTWHVSLNLENSETEYHPGDSIGVFPQNDPLLVEHLIEAMQANPTDLILHQRTGKEMSLETFLIHHANLSRITSSFLKLINEWDTTFPLKELLLPENKSQLRQFLSENDPLNLLRDYGKEKLPLQQLCNHFGPLLPRFYSVASSKQVQKNHLDLTVALFTWTHKNEKRYGVASHFLCHLAKIRETPIPFYVQPAPHFHLPKDLHSKIIMIGPGTGIAPFRAFMQERTHLKSKGDHWLFFGERNRHSDFFYEQEWKKHERLSIETAFSRDQKEKIYVQHKLLEQGEKLYDWIANGAYLYLCGDAKEMAKDVETTLQQIIMKVGGKDEIEAKAYLKELKKQGRFCLDVY